MSAGLGEKHSSAAVEPPSGFAAGSTVSAATRVLRQYGLLVALLILLAVFGALRPDTFLTIDTARSLLLQTAAPAILAIGLTVPMALGDFDLSIGSMVGLGGASAVAMMSIHGSTWQVALIAAFTIAIVAGAVTGFFTAYLGSSSFVMTLAMATILLGAEYLITDMNTLYSGIQPGYVALGQSASLFGLNNQVWMALAIAIAVYILLEKTELGRYMYAVGGNPLAARFAGINVRRLRLIGFVVVAMAAAFTGILLTAQGASSSPNAGVSYLLPAYAAVFLGSASFRPGQFNVIGTVVAALFLGVVQTGLQMLRIDTAWILILQGVVLIVAMQANRLERQA